MRLNTLGTAAPFAALTAAVLLAAFVAWRDHGRAATYPGIPHKVVGQPDTPNPPRQGHPALPTARLALPEAGLFGTQAPAAASDGGETTNPEPARLDDSALPVSTAAYRLFGIIDAAAERDRRAVIGTGDGDQREFAIGDEAPDGARVHAIRARAVILARLGVLERLDLPGHTDDSMSGLRAGPGDAPGATPAPTLPGAFDPASLPAMVPDMTTLQDDEPHSD